MKILSAVLIIVGVGLIAFGFYNAFLPNQVENLETIDVENGITRQSIAMICLGVIGIVAGGYLTKKR